MSENNKSIKAVTLFILGVISLLGLHAEYALIETEKFIFDKSYKDFSITESVTHWIVTCVMWGIVGLVLFYIAQRFYKFDLIQKKQRPTMRGLVIALLLLSSSIGVKFLLLDGWQMIVDFRREGWFQFIFLYIYHLFEAFLLLLSAAFFQSGCDKIISSVRKKSPSSPEEEEIIPTHNEHYNADSFFDHFPWGGIVLALTWGLSHYITTGGNIEKALFYTAVAFFIGCAYLAAKKNFYISYAFAAVLILV